MERTIIRKQLSDETLKQISAETVYFVFFFDNEQTAEKGCLQFFSIEKDECIVYSGD